MYFSRSFNPKKGFSVQEIRYYYLNDIIISNIKTFSNTSDNGSNNGYHFAWTCVQSSIFLRTCSWYLLAACVRLLYHNMFNLTGFHCIIFQFARSILTRMICFRGYCIDQPIQRQIWFCQQYVECWRMVAWWFIADFIYLPY